MSFSTLSRRDFILALGATTLTSTVVRARAIDDVFGRGLNILDPVSTPLAEKLRFGYAAITWDGNDVQAIKDISALSFPGIQLRSNILKEFGERPEALRALLEQSKLEMVALSSGGVSIDPAKEADEVAKHLRNAKFVKAVGGRYLQVTDSARPKDRKPEASDFKQLGRVLTQIGKGANDVGVPPTPIQIGRGFCTGRGYTP